MNGPYLQSHCRLATHDLDEAREHVGRMWERHESHLPRGRTYSLRWHQVDLNHISLSYIDSGSALHVRCGPVGGRFRFTMPETGRVRHSVNGCNVVSTPVCGVIYLPQQELRLEIEPFRSLLLTIDAGFVERAARVRFGRAPIAERWANAIALESAPAATLRSMCRWLGDELDRPGTPLRTSRQVIANLERSLLALFLDCLTPISGPANEPFDRLGLGHLRRIESWLDEHFREPIGVEDMALVAGTGVRTVQNLFRHHRGCTPSEALLQRRLNSAHQRLTEAGPRTTVTDVAFDCGFFHLSRFAALYARSFGERPSQTLAKRTRAAG